MHSTAFIRAVRIQACKSSRMRLQSRTPYSEIALSKVRNRTRTNENRARSFAAVNVKGSTANSFPA